MKLLATISVFLTTWCAVQARCSMYGECYVLNGFDKPCPYDGEPLPLLQNMLDEEKEELIAVVERRCPHLLLDEFGERLPDDDVLTCCDSTQLYKMSESLLLAEGVLGRCPSCLRNFARQICEMNCSPDQARFVTVYEEIGLNDTIFVNEIDYTVHVNFMNDAFTSCSGVIVPQTGLPAVNLMCGSAAVCDAASWFGFTGDTQSNPLAPVQVNFIPSETEENSMHVRPLACNETFEGDIPCSCVDCLITCPSGMEPTIPEICTVAGVHCAGFSVGIISFTIVVIIIVMLAVNEFKKQSNTMDSKPSEPQNPSSERKMIRFWELIFSKIGGFSASNPILIFMFTSWITFGMFFGLYYLNVTSNPIELWSAPESRSRAELNYFNSRFGPFYRAAQVYLKIDGLEGFTVDNTTFGPAYRLEAIEELVKLENAIINIGRDTGGVTLEQVCYAPLRMRGAEQRIEECITMSVSVYLGDSRNDINNNTYLHSIQSCLNNYLGLNCMASWGGGSEPEITFGGYEDNILSATTLLINLPISNFLTEEDLGPVMEWEGEFLKLLHDYEANWKSDFVDVSFAAERSIEDEIKRVSEAEVIPMAISYILMFLYVTVALGNVRYCRTYLLDSKIMVAIGSIIIVLIAIFCALGIMGFLGITTTLLAINVIPFFILSIGIDNVFLMVNTLHDMSGEIKSYDDYNENLTFEEKRKYVFSKMMAKVGPSMFVASVTQITCFSFGMLTNLPAVVTFSAFASIALSFLLIFQITAVVAILSLDYKRTSQHRLDVLCCIQKKVVDDENPLTSETPYQGVTKRLMEPYSKILLNRSVKIVVAVVFMAALCTSIILIPQIEIGLDQEMSLPVDSYVYKYLHAVKDLLMLGPPVYFVLKSGLNFTDPVHQNVICGGQLCNDDSLVTQLFLAAQYSNVTRLSKPSNSWLDDFFDWASLPGACCKYNTTDGRFCGSTDNSVECAYCSIDRSDYADGVLRPAGSSFGEYIPFFLQDTPTEICNKGGLASYFSNVNYVLNSEGLAEVHDSNFMAFHTALSTSTDYIQAVKNAYEISESITEAIQRRTGLDVEVFPYSVFYVYYEQYLTTWSDTFSSIAYCLISAAFFSLVASGFNFLTTFAVMFTALMVVLDIMGIMYLWGIPLNAVSCVNLIVSIGISVEFCSHIAYAFATSKSPPNERVEDALKSVGATVITGITFTNIPIIVLAFSYTEIIEVFFFRMFSSLVIVGFLHGMIFFPVLLCYLNTIGKKKQS